MGNLVNSEHLRTRLEMIQLFWWRIVIFIDNESNHSPNSKAYIHWPLTMAWRSARFNNRKMKISVLSNQIANSFSMHSNERKLKKNTIARFESNRWQPQQILSWSIVMCDSNEWISKKNKERAHKRLWSLHWIHYMYFHYFVYIFVGRISSVRFSIFSHFNTPILASVERLRPFPALERTK